MSQAYDFDITSANASAVLTVDSLFPSGIELQMFATDQAVGQDSVDITETRMGVDGRMVAGFTPVIYPVTVTLEAASPSARNLGTVWRAMKTIPGIYECTLVITVPSIAKVYTWSRGVMKSGVPFPSMKKVLEPTTWVFHFENMDVSGV